MTGKYTLSAFSDEYADSLVEQCEILSSLGIEYMEMRGVDGENVSSLTPTDVKKAKQILSAYGIRVSAIGSPIGKIDLYGDMAAHTELAKRVFDTALELSCERVRIFSFYIPAGKSRKACEARVFSEMEKLVLISEKMGVTLCHENEAKIYGESPECCLKLAKHFDGKLKLVFDMGNFVLDGYDPLSAYDELKGYIEYFHIKDALYAGAIVPAGLGEAKIKEILDAHGQYKSGSFITLEPHLETFSGLNALVGKSFENPYKYESPAAAFIDAAHNLRRIL